MQGVQKCFSQFLFDLAVHFIIAAIRAVSWGDGASAQNGASCNLQCQQRRLSLPLMKSTDEAVCALNCGTGVR